jgi:GNAT superfamily N-acetyltransferase
MALAFGGGPADIAVWERIMQSDPEHCADNTIVLTRDETIISACHIAPRTMCYGSALVRIAGIGSVFTIPSQRNRGHATALLKETLPVLRERGFELAILSTSIPAFYQRLGWQVIPRKARVWRLPRPRRGPQPAARQFDGVNDMSAVINIHRQWSLRAIGALVRSEDFWRRNMWYQEDRAGFLVSNIHAAPAAYARSRLRPGPREPTDLATLQEVAWSDDPEPAREVIAATLAAARRAGALRICEAIPPAALPAGVFDSLTEKEDERILTDLMGAVLDWPRLAQALQPELELRLAGASGALPQQGIAIIAEGQQALFRVSPPSVEVRTEPASPGSPEQTTTIRLSLSSALRLLFEGWAAVASPTASISPEAGAVLQTMYPPVSFYHWTQGHY